MFHTHFDGNLENANLFIQGSKSKINKLFEMYDTPEKDRNDLWQTKHDKLINELAEMTDV